MNGSDCLSRTQLAYLLVLFLFRGPRKGAAGDSILYDGNVSAVYGIAVTRERQR